MRRCWLLLLAFLLLPAVPARAADVTPLDAMIRLMHRDEYVDLRIKDTAARLRTGVIGVDDASAAWRHTLREALDVKERLDALSGTPYEAYRRVVSERVNLDVQRLRMLIEAALDEKRSGRAAAAPLWEAQATVAARREKLDRRQVDPWPAITRFVKPGDVYERFEIPLGRNAKGWLEVVAVKVPVPEEGTGIAGQLVVRDARRRILWTGPRPDSKTAGTPAFDLWLADGSQVLAAGSFASGATNVILKGHPRGGPGPFVLLEWDGSAMQVRAKSDLPEHPPGRFDWNGRDRSGSARYTLDLWPTSYGSFMLRATGHPDGSVLMEVAPDPKGFRVMRQLTGK